MLPAEYLRLFLYDARCLGHPFAYAWSVSVERAAKTSEEPEIWLVALGATREAWHRAYDRMPARPQELALARLSLGGMDELGGVEERLPDRSLEARVCRWCERPVPTDRDPRAQFCSEACGRQWRYMLERERAGALVVRRCFWCDGPIPTTRDPRSQFCSNACRRKHHDEASAGGLFSKRHAG